MSANPKSTSVKDRGAAPRKASRPYDPHLSAYNDATTIAGEVRLAFTCPSRSTGEAHLLFTDEDGERAYCTCPGYVYSRRVNAGCCHTDQARAIVRVALTNHYATLPDAALRALDGGAARGSLRWDIYGDEVGKRARMKDKTALSARARQAREELFG